MLENRADKGHRTEENAEQLDSNFYMQVTIQVLKDPQLAIGKVRVKIPGQKILSWASILGKKFTENPTNLEGACLVRGLEETLLSMDKQRRRRDGNRESRWTLEINSDFWKGLSPEQQTRWKVYGAPGNPIPNQRGCNALLGLLSTNPVVNRIHLLGVEIRG